MKKNVKVKLLKILKNCKKLLKVKKNCKKGKIWIIFVYWDIWEHMKKIVKIEKCKI